VIYAICVIYLLIGIVMIWVSSRYLGMPESQAIVPLLAWPLVLGLLAATCVFEFAEWIARNAKRTGT
jgi:hypothetical protein